MIYCLNETTQFEKLGYVRIGMGMGKDNTIRDYVDLCLKTAATRATAPGRTRGQAGRD